MTDLGLFVNSYKKKEAQLIVIVPLFVYLFKTYFTSSKSASWTSGPFWED